MTNYAVLDTETTSLEGEVVQISVIEYDGLGDNNPTIISSYIKPEEPISYGSMAIHNITNEMIAEINPPTYEEVADQIHPVNVKYVIGHNLQFDIGILSKKDERWLEYKTICTMQLANSLGLKEVVGSVSNMALFYYYSGHLDSGIDLKAHDATSDALVTNFIFKKMLEELVMDVDECYNHLNNRPFVCNFKKHEGQLWEDVVKKDSGYVFWLLDNNKLTNQQEREKIEQLIKSGGKL